MKDVGEDVDDRVIDALLPLREPAAEELLKVLRRMVGVLPAKVVAEGLVSLHQTFRRSVVLGNDTDDAVVPGTSRGPLG